MNTIDYIQEIIKETINFDNVIITKDSYLRTDLLFDSLNFIKLITKIEEKFNVIFESEKLYTKLDYTIFELAQYVDELRSEVK